MKKLLRQVVEFFISQRRSGTTRLIRHTAEHNDVWVLVPNAEMKKEFGDKGVSFDDLERMRGAERKPILVDNYTMLKLCEEFDINIKKLEEAIKERETLINSIEHLIGRFKRNEKQFYQTIGDRKPMTYFDTRI